MDDITQKHARNAAALLLRVLFLALPAGPAAAATELFSSFAGDGSYSTSTYTPVNFYTTPEVIGTELAFAFTIDALTPQRLERVEVAASWDGTAKNARFALYHDAGGLPEASAWLVLAENPEALPAVTPAVLPLPAPQGTVLRAGETYWFAVAPATLDATLPVDDYVLLWLNPDEQLTQTSRTWMGGPAWGNWFNPPISVEAVAFRVLGSPVPVPPAGVLLALGLSLLPLPSLSRVWRNR